MGDHECPYPGIEEDLQEIPSSWEYPGDSWYSEWYDVDDTLLSLREIFMMALMETLTDKPDWHKKVFDEAIVARWRKEAMEQSEQELFKRVLHQTRQPKEDSVSDGYEGVKQEEADRYSKVWNGQLTLAAHKVPYPRCRIISELAFDFCVRELRSKAAHFERTGLVPTLDANRRTVVKSDSLVDEDLRARLRDAFTQLRADQEAAGRLDWHPGTNDQVLDLVHPSMYPFVYERSPFLREEVVGVSNAIDTWAGKGAIAPKVRISSPDNTWLRDSRGQPVRDYSVKYQWLPSNVVFQDGFPRISSYINNLHPLKYSHIYQAIEKLIDLAIPAWDQAVGDFARHDTRLSQPEEADDRETEGLWEEYNPDIVAASSLQPGNRDLDGLKREYNWPAENDIENKRILEAEAINKWKWQFLRDAIYPEPDGNPEIDYTCKESLRELRKDSGLQVYVKMARGAV